MMLEPLDICLLKREPLILYKKYLRVNHRPKEKTYFYKTSKRQKGKYL